MLLLLASVAWPCTWYVYDDYGDGSADGRVYGGTFVTGGWRPDGGYIVYDLPDLVSGTLTMRLSNVDEAGIAQHDLLELFSGDDGSFSDGRRDNFLQVKFAGDIYDGYDGRVKLQAGPEWYGDVEVGAWTDEFDWDPDSAYDFTVSWGSNVAALDIAGRLSTSIDYSYYGALTFRTIRVPNDGSYTRDAGMDDIVIAGVGLCADEADADTDTDTDSDTDSDTDADTDTDTDTDADTDTIPGVPVITTFAVDEPDVTAGDAWVTRWEVTGADTVKFCFQGEGAAFESCADLPGLTGRRPMSTRGLPAGAYSGWISASGPGGEAESAPLDLSIAAAYEESSGCATVPAGGGILGVAMVLAGVRRRARPA